MKKFLVFLVAIVVVVSFGLITYYFMRNDEVITIDTKEIYCNVRVVISLDSLGIKVTKQNKNTTYNYNAGGEEVEKFIKYDEKSKSYLVSKENAGEVALKISTSNPKCSEFIINVHIGNGSADTPFYVFDEIFLAKIGTDYKLDKNYRLMNNITLTDGFKPIGVDSSKGFTGSFDGNGNSIIGLNLTGNDYTNAGLFSKIGTAGVVTNLFIDKATINGSYASAGALAGVVEGTISKIGVTNSTISNTSNTGITGSVVGDYLGQGFKLVYADNVTLNIGNKAVATPVSNTTNSPIVGGLVGKVSEKSIYTSYANNVTINVATTNGVVGGLVGEFVIGTDNIGAIHQSYANANSEFANFGAFIGKISKNATFDAEKDNMLKHFVGNMAVGKNVVNTVLDNTEDDLKYFEGFFNAEKDLYMIRGFETVAKMLEENEKYVYFAIDSFNGKVTYWDTTYIWLNSNTSLPTLRMGNVTELVSPDNEYYSKDLSYEPIIPENPVDPENPNEEPDATTSFISIFKDKDVEDQRYALKGDIDLTDIEWTPHALKNVIIDGENHTIKVKLTKDNNGYVGLFSTLDNSTITNLNIEIVELSANGTYVGALAGTVYSSDETVPSKIENVKVTYSANVSSTTITNFGGLVAETSNNTVIKGCSVTNLAFADTATITNAGGLVAVANNGSIENIELKDVKITASDFVGGFVAKNSATIKNAKGNVTIAYNKAINNARVGGIAAQNTSVITDSTVDVTITATNAGDILYIGGAVAENSGTIQKVTINGAGISASINKKVYIGGIAAKNTNTITDSNNLMTQIGSYAYGYNYYVGGVTVINNGTISKVLVSSKILGNYVAGVTVEMKESSTAKIDQVVVGVYNKETKAVSQNEINGDKFVAGVAVDFRTGTISNIQASSKITGEATTTRSSLVVLIFPNTASLSNATIDSSLNGHGAKYRESWVDFESYSNKAEFGFAATKTGDARFNVYVGTSAGKMTSVVINNAQTGVKDAKASMGHVNLTLGFIKTGDDYNGVSFVKTVNGFTDVTQFMGQYTFTCAKTGDHTNSATKTLTFDVDGIWQSNSGISLRFLDNIQ